MKIGACLEERFAASLKLSQEPRDSAQIRVRNRCMVTGRPRGYYRKLKCHGLPCDLASFSRCGIVKSSCKGKTDYVCR